MENVSKLIKLNIIKLKRRVCLLAAISAAFVMLSFVLAEGVKSITHRDSGLEIMKFAVIGADEENEDIVQYTKAMEGLEEYSNFEAMEEDKAMEALENGEVIGVIEIPNDFVNSILDGRNTPAYLHVNASSPLESTIAIYAAECASSMLAAAQGGVYAILETVKEENIVRENIIFESNIDYISFVLGRKNMFNEEVIGLSGSVPIEVHYIQTFLGFILLMYTVIFYPVLSKTQGPWRKRLSSIGFSANDWAFASIGTVGLCLAPITALMILFAGKFTVGGFISIFIFSCGFSTFIGAVAKDEGTMSAVTFFIVGLMIFLAGGIIPPVLMPKTLKLIMPHTPFSWFYSAFRGEFQIILFLIGAIMILCAFIFLKRSYKGGE